MIIIKRIWAVIKTLANAAIDYAVGPFLNLATKQSSEEAILGEVVGAAVRVIYVAGFIVAMPAGLTAFAAWWLTWALRFAIIFTVMDIISILFCFENRVASMFYAYGDAAKQMFSAKADEVAA